MDIATGLGLLGAAGVLCTIMLMGGGFGMFYSDHAIIVIFGGSFAATLIRFPLATIMHGLPVGLKYAFTLRRTTQRELVDEIAALAEIARKQGPIGLEKVEIEDTFLAKGIRFVADGYDADFIRDNLERDLGLDLAGIGIEHIAGPSGLPLHLFTADEVANLTHESSPWESGRSKRQV